MNNIPLYSSDTHPKAEEFQIQLLRQASVAERIARMRSLSETVIQLSRRAIMRANPELDEPQLNVLLIAHHYGTDLADRFKDYLDQNGL
jgi:hypothetical protein